MKKIQINNITLAYEQLGNGKPLMLIHGFPLDHTTWNETASLLENNFDLILPDLRGFGQTTTVETPYTMSDMADDLARLLDHLKIEKITLAGHSMGGYVALAFAKKYPQRVSGLGLVSSQAAADSTEGKDRRYQTAADVAQKGVGVVAEAMTPKLSADARVQAFVRVLMEKQTPSAVIGALKAMAEREDLMSHLSSVTFPVLLIHGNADVLIPIERAKEIKAVLPSARFVELHGAGHMPMMEFAKETAEGLKFLEN
ncbi:MAG: alpha/beta hydrolase [Anaerolineales bacterium]|nr:alpha/beta hydrolase [Anaerolineales bacterium]